MAPHGTSADSAAEAQGPVPGTRVPPWLTRAGPWMAGLVCAVVVLGPALGPGSLFNLDLILPPQVPVPRGAWGLGPELPRRVPLWIVVAWLSPLLGGDNVGKAIMVATIVVGFVGAYRLVARHTTGPHTMLAAYGAGFLYALNPFLLTRIAVGHLHVAIPMALLPWVVPILLRPGDRPRRTFLAAALLAFCGNYGGAIGCLIVLVGLVATRGRNVLKVIALTLLAQLPWLVPGLLIYSEGASIVDATPFATQAEGVDGVARLLAGHGFWQNLYQVGWPGGWPVAIAGVLLLGFGIAGTNELAREFRWSLVALGAIGFGLAAASATPGLSDLYVTLSRNPVGSVLREGQRALPLYLVWLAPAAVLGARRAGTWVAASSGGATPPLRAAGSAVVRVVPIALAVWLAGSAFWGIDSRLRPVQIPQEWADARDLIRSRPGTVLALPWHQYFDVTVGDGTQHVLDPMPLYLGGDVVISSDPELAGEHKERVDPRETTLDAIVADLRRQQVLAPGDIPADQRVSSRLAQLGIRWVVLQRSADWVKYTALNRDPGLEHVISKKPSLELYEVKDWRGLVVDERGAPVPATPVIEPMTQVDPSGAAVYRRPAQSGWMRGWAAASATDTGLVSLPAGSGWVWFWPAVVVLIADLVTLGAVLVAAVGEWRDRGVRTKLQPTCENDA